MNEFIIDIGSTNIKIAGIEKKTKNINIIKKIRLKYKKKANIKVEIDIYHFLKQINNIFSLISSLSESEKIKVYIANQRSSFSFIDIKNHKFLIDIISWQDKRANFLLKNFEKHKRTIYRHTKLLLESGYPALKIYLFLNKNKKIREQYENCRIKVATIDTIIYYYFLNKCYTDITNASRTLFFDIEKLKWNDKILKVFNIKKHILPEIQNENRTYFNFKNKKILIKKIIGDRQSAISLLTKYKNTGMISLGTAGFVSSSLFNKIPECNNKITVSVLKHKKNIYYYKEGVILSCASSLDKALNLYNLKPTHNELKAKHEICKVKTLLKDFYIKIMNFSKMPVFFTGLIGFGAPIWSKKRIFGFKNIKRLNNIEKILLIYLAIAIRINQVFLLINKENNLEQMIVEGGLSDNNVFLQMIADVLEKKIIKYNFTDLTLAGLVINKIKLQDKKIFLPDRNINIIEYIKKYNRYLKEKLK